MKDLHGVLNAHGITARIENLSFASPSGAAGTCPKGGAGVLRVEGVYGWWNLSKAVVNCRIENGPQSSSKRADPPRGPAREKPATKAAQIRALWPEIRTVPENGHSLKTVCECLAADGITLGVQSLGSYIGRIRRTNGKPDHRTMAAESENSISRPKDSQPIDISIRCEK